MRKFLGLAILFVCSIAAFGQTTQITASHIAMFGGQNITGQFCVTPVTSTGDPITLVTNTGQQFAPQTPLCFPIVNGVLSSTAIVPDVSQVQPFDSCYALTIYNNLNIKLGSYPCIQPTGSTWSFDAYVPGTLPSGTSVTLPQFLTNGTPNATQGTLNISGPGVTYGAGGVISIASANASSVMLYPAQCTLGTGKPTWCSGSTADAYIMAACGALPSTGGWVNLLGLTGNITATTRGCGSATKQIIFLEDPTNPLLITETDGDITFPLENGSMFLGPGKGQCTNSGGIHLSGSANVTAIIGPAHVDGSQENLTVAGACVYGETGATVSHGLLYTKLTAANTTFEGNGAFKCNTSCLNLVDAGETEITNNWFNLTDGNYSITGTPLIVQGAGSSSGCSGGDIHISKGQIEHANGGGPEILIEGNGAGGFTCDLSIRDVGIERNGSGTPSTIGIKILDCWNCVVDGLIATGTSGGSDLINISQTSSGTTENVAIKSVMAGGVYTNAINDTTPGGLVLTSTTYPQITSYTAQPGYQASGGAVSSLTTTGSSGAATLSAGVLNIPVYTGGSAAFSALTGGTNTTAAMLVGSGASLGATGSGTLTATAMPWSGLSGSPSTSQVPVQSITTTGSSGASTLSGGVLNIPQYAGGSTTFQANGTGLSSSTTVNFENSAATNGLTLTFANPSSGNVQLGFTGSLTNAGLANSATTVNSQTCTLGSSCTIPFQTNSTNNTSQAGLNLLTSTANSVGLTLTPTNSGTNQEKFEITGASYSGTASAATNLAGTGVDYAPYQSASGTTSYITAPTTNADTFVYAWKPTGSAVAPTAVNLGALPANLPTSSLVDTTTTQTITGKTLDGVSPTIMGYVDASSSIQTQLNGKAATNASTTGTAGNGAFTTNLSGATPTAAVNSTSIPAQDQNYLLMTANVTSFTLPASTAVANGEVLRITVQQGASTAYTLPTGTANSPFTAGSGTTLVNTVPTGCPTIGTTTGSVTPSEEFFVLQYHSALTEWEILGCNTSVPQAAIIEAPIQSIGTFGGTAVNTVVASISPTHSGHIANLVIVNTNASSNCTTAPTFNVFDGTTNTGTAKIGITTAQTKGNATSQSETLAFNAGDIIGIYISTAGGTCTVPIWSVSAMITEP